MRKMWSFLLAALALTWLCRRPGGCTACRRDRRDRRDDYDGDRRSRCPAGRIYRG